MSDNPRKDCPKDCPRYAERLTSPCVHGVGPTNAKIMLIGENPGKKEDKAGEPFIGRSGELLDEVLEDLGLNRKDAFITNAVRCWTHRDDPKPTDKELRLCKPYLVEEIKRVKPNVICALGATALKATLNRTGIKKLKNNIFNSKEFGIKVVPTFHPAWVLRNPGDYSYLRKGVGLAFSELSSKNLVNTDKIKTNYLVADTKAKIEKVLDELEAQKIFTMDLETNSLNYHIAKITCVSVSWQIGLGIVIPWGLLQGDLKSRFKKLLVSDRVKANHNIKYDIQVLLANGIPIHGPFFDTMTAHALVNENMNHGLEDLVLHYFDMGEYWEKVEESKKTVAKKKKIKKEEVSYDLIPTDVLYPYAAADADAAYRLFCLLSKELDRQNLLDFYANHTLPLMPILLQMEYRGIAIDRLKLKDLIVAYRVKEEKMERELHKDKNVIKFEKFRKQAAAKKLIDKYKESKILKTRYPNGEDQYVDARLKEKDYVFNFNSPKQLSELLFDQMNLEPVKKTKTGWSTDVEVMDILEERGVSLAKGIVAKRKLTKYISTYLVSTYEKSERDGRIHTSYLQHRAVSGRLASENPNMQNIPRDANDFKECFLADPGYVFLKADLAQAEFRGWAHSSNDEDMINDIESGLDIHTRVAAQVFGIEEDEVTKDQRTAAKNAVFGLMYGRGPKSIAQQYGITVEEAKEVRSVFFDMYPVATEWLEELVRHVKRTGYVKTWFGRIRRLPEIDSDDQGVRAEAERQAKNSPIQGQASDMNNAYLVRTVKRAKKERIRCFPATTTHDENAFQVKKEDVNKLKTLMADVVATAFPDFRCKMELEFGVGETLGTIKEI